MSEEREERLLPVLLLLLKRKAVKSRERKESRTGRPSVKKKKKKKVSRLHEKTGFSGNEVLAAATREGRKTHAAPEPSGSFCHSSRKKRKKKR